MGFTKVQTFLSCAGIWRVQTAYIEGDDDFPLCFILPNSIGQILFIEIEEEWVFRRTISY